MTSDASAAPSSDGVGRRRVSKSTRHGASPVFATVPASSRPLHAELDVAVVGVALQHNIVDTPGFQHQLAHAELAQLPRETGPLRLRRGHQRRHGGGIQFLQLAADHHAPASGIHHGHRPVDANSAGKHTAIGHLQPAGGVAVTHGDGDVIVQELHRQVRRQRRLRRLAKRRWQGDLHTLQRGVDFQLRGAVGSRKQR